MPPLATYVLLAACLVVFVFGFWVSGERRPSWAKRVARLGGVFQVAAVVGAYVLLRPGAGVDGAGAIAAAREHHRPIFVEFYSNF